MNSDHCLHAALGAYDPDPEETLLSALNAHRVMHPGMVDSEVTISRMRAHDADHGDIRHGAVMARESNLGADVDAYMGRQCKGPW
jgi:hypothetical protein